MLRMGRQFCLCIEKSRSRQSCCVSRMRLSSDSCNKTVAKQLQQDSGQASVWAMMAECQVAQQQDQGTSR